MDESGKQHYLDATLAYKRAVLNCIKYLSQFSYTEEQIYLLLSCCPCEGRLSGIVDVPNAVATLAIPMAIFDQVTPRLPRHLIGPHRTAPNARLSPEPPPHLTAPPPLPGTHRTEPHPSSKPPHGIPRPHPIAGCASEGWKGPRGFGEGHHR